MTGTRADFGKIKPLLAELNNFSNFEIHIFVTGMHMLKKFGSTADEVSNLGIGKVYKFINQSDTSSMDEVLAKTILGFSDYVAEISPDLIVVHGDRVEPLAGALVGSLNGILVCHIEGGEVSGTIDELLRHAISKMSHVHFVANELAKKRLIQLGEPGKSISVIGSPEIDIMNSENLPEIRECINYYKIPFENYGIAILHPVTTELENIETYARNFVQALVQSQKNYIVIHPNNDSGSNLILKEISKLKGLPNFAIFPSMRFEYFLTFLKNSEFIVGNSSAGVRQAPHFGVPAINIGTRQSGRVFSKMVINVTASDVGKITQAIQEAGRISRIPEKTFGTGDSARLFVDQLRKSEFWMQSIQKQFIDL